MLDRLKSVTQFLGQTYRTNRILFILWATVAVAAALKIELMIIQYFRGW